MKPINQIPLIKLGSNTMGGYCDPVTGECFPSEEMEMMMTTAIDPVCQMEVETENAQYKSEYAGETYYFCSAGCLSSFEKDPQKYLPQAGHTSTGH